MGNVFNRYGAGGGKSEGIYIWKKYKMGFKASKEERYGTYSFDYNGTNVCYQSSSYTVGDDGKFHLVNPSVTPYTGVTEDIWYLVDSTYYIFGDTEGDLMIMGSSTKSQYPTTARLFASENRITLNLSNSSYRYALYTPVPTPTDLVGYLVSDKEDAYPDKEVEDGYYYEKASAEMLGCTKIAKGSFTPATTTQSYSVTHDLGVVPKYAFVYQKNGGSYLIDMGQVFGESSYASATRSGNTSYIVYSYYGNTTATTSTATLTSNNNSYARFKNATTHYWILLG